MAPDPEFARTSPSETLPSEVIDIDVSWDKPVVETTPLLFGACDFKAAARSESADALLTDRLRKIGLTLLRIRLPSGPLIDPQARAWDEAAIAEAIYPRRFEAAQVGIVLPGWPAWMRRTREGLLDPGEYRNYANFCAHLVRLVNVQLKLGITYWEPMTGLDRLYRRAGRLEELWKIFNITATVMRLRDRAIRIGGPGLSEFDSEAIVSFLGDCRANVDFLCWSDYQPLSVSETGERLLAGTPDYFQRVRTLQALVSRHIPNRSVPLFLCEYNFTYPGSGRQGWHSGAIGAVWLASVLKHLIEAGLEMAACSHLRDEVFGLMSPDHRLRPSATVLRWGRQYLCGRVYPTHSTNPMVEALAVRRNEQHYALLLINKTDRPLGVRLQSREILMSNTVELHSLTGEGSDQHLVQSLKLYKRVHTLPGHALQLLLFER